MLLMSRWRKSKALFPYVWMLLGLAAFTLAWHGASRLWGPLLVATPAETGAAVLRLFASPAGQLSLYQTLARVAVALVLQVVVGAALGMLAGFYPWFEELLRPAISVLISVPPVAVALFVIFVSGGGELQVVATAVALGLPLLYRGAVAAVRTLDRDLLEMLRVYRVSRVRQLRTMYLPATLYALLPSILLAAGLTIRLMIMAEIIVGIERGIGPALSLARVHMATADIFAWMLIMATIVLLIEGLLLHVVRTHVLSWQTRR